MPGSQVDVNTGMPISVTRRHLSLPTSSPTSLQVGLGGSARTISHREYSCNLAYTRPAASCSKSLPVGGPEKRVQPEAFISSTNVHLLILKGCKITDYSKVLKSPLKSTVNRSFRILECVGR